MSRTPARNFALTPVRESLIDAHVASGHFCSASDVVPAGRRVLIGRDEAVSSSVAVSSKPKSTR